MTINQQARVEVGRWYVEEIKRRIKVREHHSDEAKAAKAERDQDFKAKVSALAEKIAKAHRIGNLSKWRENRVSLNGVFTDALEVTGGDGITLTVPVALMPELVEAKGAYDKHNAIPKDCCQEIAFLNKCLGGNSVAGFQSYVSKLASGSMPGKTELTTMLNDFLAASRPNVCKIA